MDLYVLEYPNYEQSYVVGVYSNRELAIQAASRDAGRELTDEQADFLYLIRPFALDRDGPTD